MFVSFHFEPMQLLGFSSYVLLACLSLLLALTVSPLKQSLSGFLYGALGRNTVPHIQSNSRNISSVNMPRTPVYFLSHGGPNIMEDYNHPAYAKLQDIGREITQKVRPKAVVVFSAHWQAERSTIQVNTAETQKLLYDYYNFPAHYYDVKYPNVGNKALAENVISRLRAAGIQAEGVKRGLDHGVFAPFKVAFDPERNPLNVPIVQVSLFDSDDADQHYKLGQAVEGLRDEGVQIIVSGMAVHNLRDFGLSMGRPTPMPYAFTFDNALKEAAEQTVSDSSIWRYCTSILTMHSPNPDKLQWQHC